jgi:antitoxin VapB
MGEAMALSIKTEEADRLARKLARLRGETITEAVTVALREQCAREEAKPRTPAEKLAAMNEIVAEMQKHLVDRRPVTKAEWDEINGDID